MISTKDLETIMTGGVVYSGDGQEIGTACEIYLDPKSGEPAMARVSNVIPLTADILLPLQDATLEGNTLHVPYPAAQIMDAPAIDTTEGISATIQARLYRHYADHSTCVDTTDAGDHAVEMIRSEEQLRVHSETYATERLRLSKYIVTEDVAFTIAIRREEFRLERETVPTTDDGPGLNHGPLSEGDYEMILYAERPVVTMEVVPVERITVRRNIITARQHLTEQVREEHIDTHGGNNSD